MTIFVIGLTITVGLVGVGVAVWSFNDTRNKYFNEYVSRKRSND